MSMTENSLTNRDDYFHGHTPSDRSSGRVCGQKTIKRNT